MSQPSGKECDGASPLKNKKLPKTKPIKRINVIIIQAPKPHLEEKVDKPCEQKQHKFIVNLPPGQQMQIQISQKKSQLKIQQQDIYNGNQDSPPKHQKKQESGQARPKSHRKQYLKVLHSRAEKDFPRRVHEKILQFMHKLSLKPGELIHKFLQFFNQKHNIKEQHINKSKCNITLKAIFILDCIIIKNSSHCETMQFAINDLMQKSKKIQQNKSMALQKKIMSVGQQQREKIIESKKNFHQKSSQIRDVYHDICLKIIKAETLSFDQIDKYVDQVVSMKSGQSQEGIKQVKGLRIIQERKRKESKEFIRYALKELDIKLSLQPSNEFRASAITAAQSQMKEEVPQIKNNEMVSDPSELNVQRSLKIDLTNHQRESKRYSHMMDEEMQDNYEKQRANRFIQARFRQQQAKYNQLEQKQYEFLKQSEQHLREFKQFIQLQFKQMHQPRQIQDIKLGSQKTKSKSVQSRMQEFGFDKYHGI